MLHGYKWCTRGIGRIYFWTFADFSFFLPLPGTGLAVLRGRAFPPLDEKSTVMICKITPAQLKKTPNSTHHHKICV